MVPTPRERMCGVVAIKPDQLRDLTDQQGVPRLPAVQIDTAQYRTPAALATI